MTRQSTLTPSRRGIVSSRSWWNPGTPRHPRLEVPKALLGDTDVGGWDWAAVLGDGVQEDKEIARSLVQDPVVRTTVVGAQFAQLARELRRVGECKRRCARTQAVEEVDRVVDGDLSGGPIQRVDECVYRFLALPVAIEDRLRCGHLPSSHREAPVSCHGRSVVGVWPAAQRTGWADGETKSAKTVSRRNSDPSAQTATLKANQ